MMRHDDDEEEFYEVKTQLAAVERERDHAFDELREIKRRISKNDLKDHEINSLKEFLQDANRGLKIKDETIDSLKAKLKQVESKLAEKDAYVLKTRDELQSLKAALSKKEGLLSDGKRRIEELEAELERRKESEAKLLESSTLLEKSKLDVDSIRKKMRLLEEENQRKDRAVREEIERLKYELQVEREFITRFEKGDKSAFRETRLLFDEIGILKKELRSALEAEETGKNAMDDLALALSEVATESKQAKEKLVSIEQQLKAAKEEVENLKKMVSETKKENDKLENTIDRLRLEAEDSLLAWNQKEMEFIKCIKEADDAKAAVQEENDQLKEQKRDAQDSCNASRDELKKLRDILKQALNEANVAQEAASLAREENAYLKDSLAEKDRALVTLARETERLRIHENEANEAIMELKRIIAAGSKKEAAKVEKEIKEQKKAAAKKEQEPVVSDCIEKERRLSSSFSFGLNNIWPATVATKANKDADEDPEEDDVLVDSIFDLVESPVKEPPDPASATATAPAPAPVPSSHRRTASACTDEGNSFNFENFDEAQHFDDMDIDRNSHGKKKALLRRFGDLLGRKITHPPPHPSKDVPKDLPHPPKDIPKDLPHPPDRDIQVV